jgi:hypothetical protein
MKGKGVPRLCLPSSKRDIEWFVSPDEPSSAVLTATQERVTALQTTVGHDRCIALEWSESEFRFCANFC